MINRTVLEALTSRPVGFLRSSWPWRSLLHLLSGGVLGVGTWLAVGGLFAARERIGLGVAVVCAVLVTGFAVLLSGPLERWRLRLVDVAATPVRQGLRTPAGLRGLGYGAVSVLAVGWADLALAMVALGIPGVLLLAPWQPDAVLWASVGGPVAGVLLLPVAAYPIAAWAGARGALSRAVLSSHEVELTEVRRSRARLVDAYEAERRRIERDLHDGAQQRLVALTMKLGLAALDLPPDSRAAREVAEAHAMAKDALSELRELIRGVHPQVLTERGLPAAVRDVAGRSPVPVDVDLELPCRIAESVEVAAYFAICEALTNTARHGAATRCRVSGRLVSATLMIEVYDDGRGGADPAAGSGLTGLADRVAAVDGRMLLSSPAGGPTRLRVEIPVGAYEGEACGS
ncbi:histidine kinase [Streptomyces spiroverticillatus]|uniref:histidine kinase n=1 Tax=Streptomyces finlayi TaxID=67296 RepID=A0A919CAT8_9ACTN|nr:histidine kinase [Streptomyces finlayi]GHA14740.1 histidine kinase [Streptomyces spiroverticillatus]GHC97142.1 histidine kinase [Streptomyces finlayi]